MAGLYVKPLSTGGMAASDGLETVQPSEELRTQITSDEEVAWVVETDTKNLLAGAVAGAIGALPGAVFLAAFAGVFVGAFALDSGGVLGLAPTTAVALVAGGILIGLPGFQIVTGTVGALLSRYEYAATSDRILAHKDTFSGTQTNSVPVDRVRDVEYSRGTIDKLVGTGDVTVQGVRQADRVDINNVPNADAVLRAVREHADIHADDRATESGTSA
jgi:membrane protein YdbS with pleckstrin-like domain